MRRWSLPVVLLLVAVLGPLLVACGEVGYYAQAVRGHTRILLARRSITTLLADPATPLALKEKLTLAQALRDFASQELGLPENGSYRCYVALAEPQVVWNVVATPEFSLQPLTWCFPVAGCVGYRGYYRREAAEAFVAQLRQQGNEVDLYGVAAYSTLGWFDDPLLSTFLERPAAMLAGTIFHELAHQQLYVQDDSAFSEAFAELVEEEGVVRWQRQGGQTPQPRDAARQQRQQDFIALLMKTRGELESLYASNAPAPTMRTEKTRILDELRGRYEQLRNGPWQGYAGYDSWFERPVNNARLAGVATYHDRLPALRQLLRDCAGDLPRFYRAAEELGRLPREERHKRLDALEQAASAALQSRNGCV